MSLRIVPVNFLDQVTDLAVSPAAVTGMPITNLQLEARDRLWRSTSLSPQIITGTFGGGARQISHLSIWPEGSGASSLIGAQVAVRMWSDVAQTTLVRNVAATDFFTFTGANWNEFLWSIQSWGVDNADRTARLAPLITWFSPIAVSAFEITITNAGAVDTNYFEASRIWLGDYVQAPSEAGVGVAPQWKSGSQLQRNGGTLRRIARTRWRELRFETKFETEADRSAWADILYVCDPANECLVSLYAANGVEKLERDYTVRGSLEALNPIVLVDQNYHKLQLAVVES